MRRWRAQALGRRRAPTAGGRAAQRRARARRARLRAGLALRSGRPSCRAQPRWSSRSGMTRQAARRAPGRRSRGRMAVLDRRARRTLRAQRPAVRRWPAGPGPGGRPVVPARAGRRRAVVDQRRGAWDTDDRQRRAWSWPCSTPACASTTPTSPASCCRATTSSAPTSATSANDGDGRDADASDPGDWVTAAEIGADPATSAGCERRRSSWHGTQIGGIIGAADRQRRRHGRHRPQRAGAAGARARQVRRLRLRHPGRHALGRRALPCPACRPTRTRRAVINLSLGQQRRLQRRHLADADRRGQRRRHRGRGRGRQQRRPRRRLAGQLPRRDRAWRRCAMSAPRSAIPTSGPRSRSARRPATASTSTPASPACTRS